MPEKRKIEAIVKLIVKHHNIYLANYQELENFLAGKYGYAPGDVDCDEIIDSLCGGCGMATFMPVDEIYRCMEEAIELYKD